MDMLETAIRTAGNSFQLNELAFLSLTSKIERPFVDRLAFALFQSLPNPKWNVTREWALGRSRTDLAVLRRGSPTLIVEAKAMASFDCTRPGRRESEYPHLLQADLDRLSTIQSDARIYSLLLAVHPHNGLPKESTGVLAYPSGFNSAFNRLKTEAEIRRVCTENLFKHLMPDITHQHGSFLGGQAFGVTVELLWWLFGPFSAPNNLRICPRTT